MMRKTIVMFCLALLLGGCADGSDVEPTTQITELGNVPQTVATELPSYTAIPFTEAEKPVLSSETPPPVILDAKTSTPPETTIPTAIEIGLEDGAKVKLIINGEELESSNSGTAITGTYMQGEVLFPDPTYVLYRIKKVEDVEETGFFVIIDEIPDSPIQVYIENKQYSLNFIEGEYSFTCNDETLSLSVPMQNVREQLCIPLKAFANAVGATFELDEKTQTVSIFY